MSTSIDNIKSASYIVFKDKDNLFKVINGRTGIVTPFTVDTSSIGFATNSLTSGGTVYITEDFSGGGRTIQSNVSIQSGIVIAGTMSVDGASTLGDLTVRGATVFTGAASGMAFSGLQMIPTMGPTTWVIWASGDTYRVLNTNTGVVQVSGTDIGAVMNTLQSGLVNGDTIAFRNGTYSGATTYTNIDKRNITYIGNGSMMAIPWQFISSGNILVNSRPRIVNFNFSGSRAGITFDSTFAPVIDDCTFDNCSGAVIITSTHSSTELWRISNTHFNACDKSILFQGPTISGTGSYINGVTDNVTFNTYAGLGKTYTFIEVQSGAEVSECKMLNSRLWFGSPSGIGIHFKAGSVASRHIILKPFFENFAGASGGTTGILVESGSTATQWFVGRPTFAGNYASGHKFQNTNNVHMHGPITTWLELKSLTVGTSSTFGAKVDVLDQEDYVGFPPIQITIGGSVAAGEIITVEIKSVSLGGITFTVTKTYASTGTFALDLNDYNNLITNQFYYVLDHVEFRCHSNQGSTSATVVVGGAGAPAGLPTDTTIKNLTISGTFNWRGTFTSGGVAGGSGASFSGLIPQGYISIGISGRTVKIPCFN